MSKLNNHLIAGVIGGLGPQATVDFYQKILNFTPAQKDQDHFHLVIDSFPQIPDRTAAILDGGEDPTPYLIQAATKLEQYGAHIIAVPCNSAHFFLPAVREVIGVPILDMIALTANNVKLRFQSLHQGTPPKVGLLATTGTVRGGLYKKALEKVDLELVMPSSLEQSQIMAAITQIKAAQLEEATNILIKCAQKLAAQGAKLIIAGCTEIPLVLNDGNSGLTIIDTTEVLAREVVRLAKSPR